MAASFTGDEDDLVEGVEVEEDHRPPKHPRFDPSRRVAGKRMERAVLDLARWLTTKERELGLRIRSRTDEEDRKFRLAVEALAANLVASLLSGANGLLDVPRQHAMMSGPLSCDVYGRHFISLLDLLEHPRVALTESVSLGFHVKGGPKQASTIRALRAFADSVPAEDAIWDELTQDINGAELIVLKGKKGKDGKAPVLELPDMKKVDAIRVPVRRINRALQAGRIEIVNPDTKWPIDPSNRLVRRYFNNGSFGEGGRLFGGFWMPLPRSVRFATIRLDGQPVVNVDYEQLFPCLAYTVAMHDPPEGDLYDIDGRPEHRKGWKKILNALLFAQKPLANWPKDTRGIFPEGVKFKDMRDLVFARHAPIANSFCKGIGYHLMYAESEMLLYVLARLARQQITALPLHDAVLVGESHGEAARQAMEGAISRYTTIRRAMVKVEKAER